MIPGSLQFFPQVSAAGSKGRKAKITYTAKLAANKIKKETAKRLEI
jgi:hypothetical protein